MELQQRQLEIKYSFLYSKVYEKRAAYLRGESLPDEEAMQAAFDHRQDILSDAFTFGTVEVPICDTKDLQGVDAGVPGFWLRAMLANKTIASKIQEKDRPILQSLADIKLTQHTDGYGFDLAFFFDKNSYLKDSCLKKTFVMCKENVIEKCIGQQIQWISGADPTKQKKRKGKGKKKSTVLVKAESFFNFFETVDADKPSNEPGKDESSDDAEEGKETDAKLDSDDNDPQAAQMEQDFDLGSAFRDDLIPQALEYYLGVVDDSSEDSEGDWGEDDEDDDEEEANSQDGKKAKKAKEPSN
jgi:nucleosome assembly protein 1-like 1